MSCKSHALSAEAGFGSIVKSHISFGNAIMEALIFSDVDSLKAHNVSPGNHENCLLGKWIKKTSNESIEPCDTMDDLKNKHISYHTAANSIINQLRSDTLSKEMFEIFIESQDALTAKLYDLVAGRES